MPAIRGLVLGVAKVMAVVVLQACLQSCGSNTSGGDSASGERGPEAGIWVHSQILYDDSDKSYKDRELHLMLDGRGGYSLKASTYFWQDTELSLVSNGSYSIRKEGDRSFLRLSYWRDNAIYIPADPYLDRDVEMSLIGKSQLFIARNNVDGNPMESASQRLWVVSNDPWMMFRYLGQWQDPATYSASSSTYALSPWSRISRTQKPEDALLAYGRTEVADGRLYLLAAASNNGNGMGSDYFQSEIYKRVRYAPILADGKLGDWVYSPERPYLSQYVSSVAGVRLGSRIYQFRQFSSQRESIVIEIASDGSFGQWRDAGPYPFYQPGGNQCGIYGAFVYKGNIYAISLYRDDGYPITFPILRATIAADGSFTDWTIVGNAPLDLPEYNCARMATVVDDYLFFGDRKAPMLADGSIGDWEVAGFPPIPGEATTKPCGATTERFYAKGRFFVPAMSWMYVSELFPGVVVESEAELAPSCGDRTVGSQYQLYIYAASGTHLYAFDCASADYFMAPIK